MSSVKIILQGKVIAWIFHFISENEKQISLKTTQWKQQKQLMIKSWIGKSNIDWNSEFKGFFLDIVKVIKIREMEKTNYNIKNKILDGKNQKMKWYCFAYIVFEDLNEIDDILGNLKFKRKQRSYFK